VRNEPSTRQTVLTKLALLLIPFSTRVVDVRLERRTAHSRHY
jgi:hypothetical protein